jgi:hypothetical protein
VDKPMLVVAAKIDVANPDKLAKLKKYCDRRGYALIEVSAVAGSNIQKLKYSIGAIVRQMRQGSYQGPKPRALPRVAAPAAKAASKSASQPNTKRGASKAVKTKKVAKGPAKKKSMKEVKFKAAKAKSGKARATRKPKKLSGRKRATSK